MRAFLFRWAITVSRFHGLALFQTESELQTLLAFSTTKTWSLPLKPPISSRWYTVAYLTWFISDWNPTLKNIYIDHLVPLGSSASARGPRWLAKPLQCRLVWSLRWPLFWTIWSGCRFLVNSVNFQLNVKNIVNFFSGCVRWNTGSLLMSLGVNLT